MPLGAPLRKSPATRVAMCCGMVTHRRVRTAACVMQAKAEAVALGCLRGTAVLVVARFGASNCPRSQRLRKTRGRDLRGKGFFPPLDDLSLPTGTFWASP